MKPKKQTEIERFVYDFLFYKTASRPLNHDDIIKCYLEFQKELADEKIQKINIQVGRV